MSGCVGMMWFDNNTKTSLNDKVKAAAEYFRTKYGVEIGAIYVHRLELEKESIISGFHVIPLKTILPFHFWVCPKQEIE